VPTSRTKFRIMWLLVEPNGADVCVKDPGFAVDLTLRGDIRDWVAVYLGRRRWCAVAGNALRIEGDRKTAKMLETWLELDAASSPDDAGSHAPTRPVHSQPAKRLQGFRQAPGRIIPGCGLPTTANAFDGGLAIVASVR
jgi:hypothetical protein